MSGQDTTNGIPSTQVLRAEIKALKETIEAGFASMNKRLDENQKDSKEVSHRVHDLEIFKAKEEAREDPAKIAVMQKEIDDLKVWRWKIMGASSILGAVLGGGGSEALKGIAKALGGG